MSDGPDDGKGYWLDNKRNIDKTWYALLILCAALFLGDALYHKHTHFSVEGWFGFYGIYGFVACAALVLAARVLRVILMRPEDYYDKADD